MVIAPPGGGKRLDPPVEDMMIAPPGPVHTGSLVKDLKAMGIGQDQVWALSSAASKTMSGPRRSLQLLAAKRHFTVLNGFGNHGHVNSGEWTFGASLSNMAPRLNGDAGCVCVPGTPLESYGSTSKALVSVRERAPEQRTWLRSLGGKSGNGPRHWRGDSSVTHLASPKPKPSS